MPILSAAFFNPFKARSPRHPPNCRCAECATRLLNHEEHTQNLIRLLLVATAAGLLTGVMGGVFHYLLDAFYAGFMDILMFWHDIRRGMAASWLPGWAGAMLLGGLCLSLARALVRLAPDAAGSGIQQIEGVFRNLAKPAPLKVLPIKLLGSVLGMAPGSALGREGPTVQMAAVIGHACSKVARLRRSDRFLIYTAVAGSGIAAAFNAPLAGAAFAIEEVARQVSLRRILVTLTAVAMATFALWGLYGNHHEFVVLDVVLDAVAPGPLAIIGMIMLGGLCGGLGALYNHSILGALHGFDAFPRVPPELRAGLIGMLVGLLAWYYPLGTGGGEAQVQRILSGELAMPTIAGLLVVRWIMGPLCYSAGTPGGIFAPLLLLGAAIGALFASVLGFVAAKLGISPAVFVRADFAVVGMAALFAGIVRAPLTGVLLLIEMTGSTLLLVPLLSASVAAVVIASLLRNEPIYDSLLARMLAGRKKPSPDTEQGRADTV